jgi:hypothetical protein
MEPKNIGLFLQTGSSYVAENYTFDGLQRSRLFIAKKKQHLGFSGASNRRKVLKAIAMYKAKRTGMRF